MKWIIIIVGTLVLLGFLVWLVGKLLPQKHTATKSITLPHSANLVWSKLVDFRAYANWRPNITELNEIDSVTWKEKDKRGDTITFRMEIITENEKLITRIIDKNLPFGGMWTYDLTISNGETTLTITEDGEVYNPIFRFISHFFMDQSATISHFLHHLEKSLK